MLRPISRKKGEAKGYEIPSFFNLFSKKIYLFVSSPFLHCTTTFYDYYDYYRVD